MKMFGAEAKGQAFHFIGVGGIGMSGIAQILAGAGATVSGSDSGTKGDFGMLERAGVKVFKGHDAKQVPASGMVVTSTAVKEDNVEVKEARKRGLKVVHRADVLAEIMKGFSTIAVSGTHGKTSTTALVFCALKAGGVPVGIINGGILQDLGTNAVLPPKDGWLVVEADESDASFLKYKPTIAVITNIEPEHMDTYGTEAKLVEAFVDFADSADEVVICADDPTASVVAAQTGSDVVTYGLDEGADVHATMYAPQGGGMSFDVNLRGGMLEDVVVALPGVHYVANSLAALAVLQMVKGDVVKGADGLATFKGVGRRFTKVGQFHGADIIDDYGHHPTEIATTLEAAKSVYTGRVIAVIQPHRYTRLRDLMDEFAGCAKVADVCVIMPVYSAGEDEIEGVNHEELGVRMEKIGRPEEIYVVDGENGLMKALHHVDLKKGDAVVCLGAGTITDYAKHLAEHHHP